MWFGDLVTPRWWDGTWLKESFADLMGYHVTRGGHRVRRRVDDLRRPAQGVGLPPGPAAHDAPDRRGRRRPRGGAAELRRHHLRQGRVGAQAADGLRRAGRSSSPAPATTSPGTRTATPSWPTCSTASSGRPGATCSAWSRAWLETSGISRLDPVVETGPDGRITRLAVTQDGDRPGDRRLRRPPAPRGRRPVRARRRRAAPGPVDRDRRRRRRGPRSPEAVGGPAALVLVNDDDLTYAKVRLDPGSLATVRAHLATIPASLSRALVWSALWNATRDAELPASDYLDVAFRQVGREPAADLLDTVLGEVGAAIERLPAGGAAGRGALPPRRDLPRRAAGRGAGVGRAAHLGPAPHPRRGRRARTASPRCAACSTAARCPRTCRSTPTCAGPAGWRWPRRTRRRPPSWTPRWPRTTR